MRRLTLLLTMLLAFQYGQAQINELGLVLGGSNFIGDVGSTNYIAPNSLAIGGIYKWNRSPRHSYRFSLLLTDLKGVDNKSNDPSRIERDYEFNSSITELSIGLEYTFVDFDLHAGGTVSTPYIATGVTAANYDDFYFNTQGRIEPGDSSKWAFGIPIALGYKTSIATKFILAFEIGARYTFTDGLDGSVPENEDLQATLSFGNTNNNDWYVFTGITLTYTFGRNPCFCPD